MQPQQYSQPYPQQSYYNNMSAGQGQSMPGINMNAAAGGVRPPITPEQMANIRAMMQQQQQQQQQGVGAGGPGGPGGPGMQNMQNMQGVPNMANMQGMSGVGMPGVSGAQQMPGMGAMGGPGQSPLITTNMAQMQALRGINALASMGGAGPGAGSNQTMANAHRMAMAQNAQIREKLGGLAGASPSPAGPSGATGKKKRRQNPAQQTLPRAPPPPRHTESYRQQALLGPGAPGGPGVPGGPGGPNSAPGPSGGPAHAHQLATPGGVPAPQLLPGYPDPRDIEPWADPLDEVDPREMAMGRFRARQEVLSEIFSVEPIKAIQEQTAKYDPWAGLGMSIEELASKVEALEKDNDELAAGAESTLTAYKQRLLDAGSKAVELA